MSSSNLLLLRQYVSCDILILVKNLIKIIYLVIIFTYLFVPFLFVPTSIHMMDNSHDAMAMADCPYMNGGQSLCPFELSYYLSIWKSVFLSSILNIKFVLLLFVLLIVTIFVPRLIFYDELTPYVRRSKTRVKILYQELFSVGLLNPKVF